MKATGRIVIDGRQILRPQPRGLGKAAISLIWSLARRRPEWQFVVVSRKDVASTDAEQHKLFTLANVSHRSVGCPLADRLNAWEQTALPLVAACERASLIHFPANTASFLTMSPRVVTIADLIPILENPQDPLAQDWFRVVRRAARRAAHILTVSEYSKRQILEHCGVSDERITVFPQGPHAVEPLSAGSLRHRKLFDKVGLTTGEAYIFAFGAADPRKNTAKIVESISLLSSERGKKIRLVVVGLHKDQQLPFARHANDLGVRHRVLLNDYLTDQEVATLLEGAAVLAFPSRNEGFGLPLVDAFELSTPVVTGNRTSLPEVAGDAALCVPPDEPEAIAEAIDRVLEEPRLSETLIERGKNRLQIYNWSRAAEVVEQVYEKTMQNRSS